MYALGRCILASVLTALAVPLAAPAATGSDSAASSQSEANVVLWQPGDPGERLFLRGRVVDPGGRPLSGAQISLRQADGTGSYHPVRYRATFKTASDGTFSVSTVLPGQYWGAKHIHLTVRHEAQGQLTTRILFKGDPHLNEAGDHEFAILLEQVRKDGETVLVGGVELVLPPRVGN